MAIIHTIADYQQVLDYIQSTGTFNTVAEAIEAGVVQSNGMGGFQIIQGGAGSPVVTFQSALQASKDPSIWATAAKVATAGVTLAKQAGSSVAYALNGLMTLTTPTVAAICAPLAGYALGKNLYEENPALWTKISSVLLPFAYDEDKFQAYIQPCLDAVSGTVLPVVCLPTAIIDALKGLFESEGVHSEGQKVYPTPYGNLACAATVDEYPWPEYPEYPFIKQTQYTTYGAVVHDPNSGSYYCYTDSYVEYKSNMYYGTYSTKNAGWSILPGIIDNWSDWIELLPRYEMPIEAAQEATEGEWYYEPGTPGIETPVIEPWTFPGFDPDFPIIIVEPGEEPEVVPVTPVTPLLPEPDPVPLLPEYVPDPTPEEEPENWPEEDPWPTTIPFPVQPTEPDPDWPEVMPWPLPPETPDQWPTTPEIPTEWPEEYPDDLPWPKTPEDWPEEVPWPDHPPEDWPEEVPWPESPEDWPEEVPWPVPWPDDWPDDQPWPIKWPTEIPYPWPFPYPKPSDNPYPDPTNPEDPHKQVDPFIDPWPWPWPAPYPSPDPTPDPYPDPTQPDPKPVQPTEPEPQPDEPYPTPPKGEPDPPIPPIIPLPFSSTTGLISVYHPTQAELLAFASWLWVTWQDATIDKIWNNPFDGVITLFELYCTPTDVGRKNIRSGFLDSQVSSETISRYTSIDCGSIGVPEYFGNYFDYSPYSKCHVYLPFIGIVELNVDDIVGHGVNITYRIDEYNGSCIAMITCALSTEVNGEEVDYSAVTYQFSGNCAVELPLAGGSQAAIKAGMMEAAAWGIGSVIGGVLTGTSLGGIGAGLAYGAASAVHSVVSAKSSVQHSGSFGSSYGAMGGKKPYLIVTRPKQIQVPNYNQLYGYQAHKTVRIGDCTGYLRCREVHVISPTASDEEKAKIEELLKLGVYVTE